MKNENYTNTKSFSEIINKNIIHGFDSEKIKSKDSKSSKAMFKLFTKHEEDIKGIRKHINIKNIKIETNNNNTITIDSEKYSKSKSKKVLHQTSHSTQCYLPLITHNSPKINKSPVCKYSTLDKIKKVENIFRTELRLRENIKKSIYTKSIDMISITESDNYIQEDNSNTYPKNSPCEIVEDFSGRIKTEITPFDLPHFPYAEKNIKKRIPLKILRRKNDYNSINGKLTFLGIVNDNELMRRVFNDNMACINRKINQISNKARETEI
jgi:hypothetical protein